MKKLILVLFISLSACSHLNEKPVVLQNEALPTAFFGTQVKSKRLSNGMQVVIASDPSFNAISYQTWIKAGTIDESPGKTGVGHLIEYLMFQGTAKNPDQPFFKKLEAFGAQVGGSTSRDYTLYYDLIAPNLLGTAIALESDRIRSVRVDDADAVRQAILVSLEEHRIKIETNPTGKLQDALWSLALRRHPYRAPLMGYVNDLLAIDPSAVKEFYRRFYQPANTTLVIAGNLDLDATFAQVEAAYSGWTVDSALGVRSVGLEPEQNEERRKTVTDLSLANRMGIAYPVATAFDPDCWTADILSEARFGDETSIWAQALTQDKKIFLSIRGQAITPYSQGLLIIEGAFRQGVSAAQALAAIDEQISSLTHLARPSEALRRAVTAAKKRMELQFLMQIRSPAGTAQALGLARVIAGNELRALQDRDEYAKVTAEQVLALAKKIFEPNRRSVIAGGAL